MAEKRDELINKMSDKIVNWYGGKADWPTLVVIVHEIMALALGEALPQLAKSRKRVEVLEEALCGMFNLVRSLVDRNRIKWQDGDDEDMTRETLHDVDVILDAKAALPEKQEGEDDGR